MSGRVFLVGAGPGDPELLTLKALRLLRTADVVLHDDLVSAQILELIPATTCVQNVGKRCGRFRTSQRQINTLMVEHALQGSTVVRLKGGDPQIFGQAWDEIEALRDTGIEFEIVPGITAALGAAASAQVPLTARSIAPGVAFVTYRRAEEQKSMPWRELIASSLTLPIYMPGVSYDGVASDLIRAGMDGETACLLVSGASTEHELLARTSLKHLCHHSPLPPPTILIVGEVVRGECALFNGPVRSVDLANQVTA